MSFVRSKRSHSSPKAKSEKTGPVNRIGAGHARPAPQIERRPTDNLVPDAYNAQKHSETVADLLAEMVKKFGWTSPVLVDQGGLILPGHLRVLAARELELEFVPVVVARGWTKT
jgi:ParB-like chromosome segregation protein Spo0J